MTSNGTSALTILSHLKCQVSLSNYLSVLNAFRIVLSQRDVLVASFIVFRRIMLRLFSCLLLVLFLTTAVVVVILADKPLNDSISDIYTLKATDIDGREINFEKFRGKVS